MVSRLFRKDIKKDNRMRNEYFNFTGEVRIKLLIAKMDLGLTVREATQLLEIPYQNAKTICREFAYERKVLSCPQMKRYQQATSGSFKMEPSTFDRLRKEILNKL